MFLSQTPETASVAVTWDSWLGRIWTNSAFWMFLASMFINHCSSFVFLVKVSMNEFLRLIFVFLLFWLHLHLKWSCLSFPDQRLCFTCVWCEFTGRGDYCPQSSTTHRFFFFFSFFVFAPTRKEGNRAEKLFSYCAEMDWQNFRYTANFLPDVFFFFIYLSGIYNIFRNHVLPALIWNMITTESLVCILH